MEHAIQEVKRKVAEELENFAKRQALTPEEVKCMGEFVDMAKDISTIEGMDTYSDYLMEDDGYSGASYRRGRMSYGRTYHDGMSGRRGRSATTGRYVNRDDGRMSENRGSSYDDQPMSDGQSRHSINDRMIDALERMYNSAASDHERQIVDKWIKKIDSED